MVPSYASCNNQTCIGCIACLIKVLLQYLIAFDLLFGALAGSNNAGVMATPFELSKDGIEIQFATNHVGMHSIIHTLDCLVNMLCMHAFLLL